MKYIELASYLATANVLLAEAEKEDNTDVTANIRQALCKVYPVKDTPGYYTDETGRYLFMEKWCEEEKENANIKDRTENR